MKANEFITEAPGIGDYFNALTGNVRGKYVGAKEDYNLVQQIKKMYPTATPSELKELLDAVKKGTVKLDLRDPEQIKQTKKKADLMKKYNVSPAELEQMIQQKADKKIVDKSIRRQKEKLKKQGNQQPAQQTVNKPPVGAVLPSKQYGDIVFKGNMWTSRDGVVKFNSPDAVKNLNRSYFQAKQAGVI